MNRNTPKSPIKILVVEDSKTQAEYLRNILKNEGYRVVLAANGHEALEQIKNDRPALVLSDILMPEMDGYELCRRIRSDAAIATIPVILVTQLFDPVDVIKGLEAGADSFIIKPFEPQHVYSRVQSVLQMLARPDPDGRSSAGIEVSFADSNYTITAGRLQVLNILLSTYDLAIKKNTELSETHERLSAVNEELKVIVEKLKLANDDLLKENIEKRNVEEALEKANKKLHLLNEVTHHDLLNNFTALFGYFEIIKEKTVDKNNLEFMKKQEIILSAIREQINFTGYYQNIGIVKPQWQYVENAIREAASTLPLGRVVLNLELGKTEIRADPLLIRVFYNLMENALRHGGHVTEIRYHCEKRPDGLAIIYEDNGIGVPVKNKERIFVKGMGKNSGLGLFLIKEILAITKMTICENGEPDKGARFEIFVPDGMFRYPAH